MRQRATELKMWRAPPPLGGSVRPVATTATVFVLWATPAPAVATLAMLVGCRLSAACDTKRKPPKIGGLMQLG